MGKMQIVGSRGQNQRVASGWNAMAETLEQFVRRRRRELDDEINRLQASLDAARAEHARIERVASSIGATEQSEDSVEPTSETRAERSAPFGELTIKTMVLNVLSTHPSGLTALAILALLNRRRDKPFARTSLSPQLSRLKTDGKIHREGRTWRLGPGPKKDGQDDVETEV